MVSSRQNRSSPIGSNRGTVLAHILAKGGSTVVSTASSTGLTEMQAFNALGACTRMGFLTATRVQDAAPPHNTTTFYNLTRAGVNRAEKEQA